MKTCILCVCMCVIILTCGGPQPCWRGPLWWRWQKLNCEQSGQPERSLPTLLSLLRSWLQTHIQTFRLWVEDTGIRTGMLILSAWSKNSPNIWLWKKIICDGFSPTTIQQAAEWALTFQLSLDVISSLHAAKKLKGHPHNERHTDHRWLSTHYLTAGHV